MLTKITLVNFKRFDKAEIELANPVVFIGPNNSGKTSALQALALWDIGLKKWNERRKGRKNSPEKRPGVTINRRDLIAMPVPNANHLWHDLHVRDTKNIAGKPETKNVRIEILVEGITESKPWACGFEFDFANEESLYCRPLRKNGKTDVERMEVPDDIGDLRVAFLPPMSGLATSEDRLDPGSINVRIGEGRTAEVLRNLCYKVFNEDKVKWGEIVRQIEALFRSRLNAPEYIAERGQIKMTYKENDVTLDISSSGRGLQQILLLLSYMHANPGATLLLDEPDAHLEILRQREVYDLLTSFSERNANQIIAASHSEILLNEAAQKDVVIAFVGKPHRLNNQGAQLSKALCEIGFEHYYQAQLQGWVLYLEGATDLSILKSFADKLKYKEAMQVLERPFVHYVCNNYSEVNDHFYGLHEAYPGLIGFALFDKPSDKALKSVPSKFPVDFYVWKKREIENYLCFPETLLAYAESELIKEDLGPLFSPLEKEKRVNAMKNAITDVENALKTMGKALAWSDGIKASDDFLEPVFNLYFKSLGIQNLMLKKNYHELSRFVPREKIDSEIVIVLKKIVSVAQAAPLFK